MCFTSIYLCNLHDSFRKQVPELYHFTDKKTKTREQLMQEQIANKLHH